MEKKYYDLIISLMEKHKKYADYESIADKIAEDVYEHAKMVLKTVEDEEAVIAYLTKIIATSMITVPKKLNLNTGVRTNQSAETIIAQALMNKTEEVCTSNLKDIYQTIELENTEDLTSATEEETSYKFEEENLTSEEEEEELSNEFTEEDLTSVEEELSNEFTEEDLTSEEEEEKEELLNEFEEDDLAPAEEIEEKEEEKEEEETAVSTISTDSDKDNLDGLTVNKTLVDNMINGLPAEKTADTDIELFSQLGTTDNTEGLTEIYDNLDFVEPTEEETDKEPFEINNSETLLFEDSNANEPEPTEEDLAASEVLDSELVEESDNALLSDIGNDFTDLDINQMEETSISDLLDSDENTEVDTLEPLGEETSLIEQQELDDKNLSNDEYSIPSYKCFNYTPSAPDYYYGAEEFKSFIDELDKKQPDKQILTVCKLKYQKNCTVEDISAKLNITKEEVLDILNQIINAIKE